jgi:two-component system, NarL family, invasion response regulator UvrY
VIKVLVADDHAVVREGIKRIIADTEDISVTGEAADGPELLEMAGRGRWDVILLDLSMPGTSGLDALHQLRAQYPDLPILVLSIHPEEQYGVRALTAGASGYVQKTSPPADLIQAIRTVAEGRRYVTPAVASSLASRVDRLSPKLPHERLSNREFQVMCLIASGKSVGDIARELSLSVKTVSTFRGRILEKLKLRHNAEITRYAIRHGLVD